MASSNGNHASSKTVCKESENADLDASLLPILSRAIPTISSYKILGDKIVQANAEGVRVQCHHDDTTTELFVKRVSASSYTTKKSWTDLRRTLVYLRTEVRFYDEFAPRLIEKGGLDPRIVPECYHASYVLGGLVDEADAATDAAAVCPYGDDDDVKRKESALEGRGGHMVLLSLGGSDSDDKYFQDSPLTPSQAARCLRALANLHAASWGDLPLLQDASDRLSDAGGSYHLRFRNPKELEGMVDSWTTFRNHFRDVADGLLDREGVADLGQRVKDMAAYVSDELSPRYDDNFATVVHGDYKGMNVFLPTDEDDEHSAVLIDFSCTGIGYGMSDVAMHINHAVLPHHLKDGGEERLVEGYMDAFEEAVNRKHTLSSSNDDEKWTLSREVAWRQYQLACIDYLRFILGRFWKSATLETFEKRKKGRNTTLVNRDLGAALAFIEKVEGYLTIFEKERKDRQSS